MISWLLYMLAIPCLNRQEKFLTYFILVDPNGVKKIVSIGQFRPEKDHALQIRAMFNLRQIVTESEWEQVNCSANLICTINA